GEARPRNPIAAVVCRIDDRRVALVSLRRLRALPLLGPPQLDILAWKRGDSHAEGYVCHLGKPDGQVATFGVLIALRSSEYDRTDARGRLNGQSECHAGCRASVGIIDAHELPLLRSRE